jgi:hypothetical protein
MKRFVLFSAVLTAFVFFLASCNREDVGPLQEGEQTFSATGFDRIEMGSGFDVTVQPGATFGVVAKGDQRNLDDLEVAVRSGTLTARYRTNGNRKFTTSFTITMPTLRGANFSGGVHSTVKGFANLSDLDIELSGGSHGAWEIIATRTKVNVSGGSKLQLTESQVSIQDDVVPVAVNQLTAEVSGGSKVEAFRYEANEVTVTASGASHAEVTVRKALTADASGASHISYKGDPTTVKQNASGASKIERN